MELPIRISQQSREPIYHQIENQIQALIASGQLQSGMSLPSIRKLSKDLEVSVITTRRAYQNLEIQGFIQTLQGKGTFVADLSPSLINEIKQESVSQAFHEAIETAYQHNFTKKQIKDLFLSLLESRKGD